MRCAIRWRWSACAKSIEYTEDWHFLLPLLEGTGSRFHALPTTLSEFRIASDGNLAKKRDPANWRATSLTIRQYINNSKFPIPGSDLARWTALASAPAVSTPDSLPVEAPRFRVDSDEVLVAALQRQIGALEDSLSWRCTAPLRYALGCCSELVNAGGLDVQWSEHLMPVFVRRIGKSTIADLLRAAESVLSQECSLPQELLIIDDGSDPP